MIVVVVVIMVMVVMTFMVRVDFLNFGHLQKGMHSVFIQENECQSNEMTAS